MRQFSLLTPTLPKYRWEVNLLKAVKYLSVLLFFAFSANTVTYAAGGCAASFTYQQDPAGTGVQFTSASSGNITHYYWYFGDGTSSTKQDPHHYFKNGGAYTVCLYVVDSVNSCVDTLCTVVQVAGGQKSCEAAFTWNADTTGHVYFSDQSTGGGALSYIWDFGDGSTSYDQSPVHKYSKGGSYYVCLTVIDSLNNCMDKSCSTIQVSSDSTYCYAYFSYQATGKNNDVAFYNYSAGAGSWFWDFGDSTYSYDKDPVHSFPGPGTYYVCLTIKDNNCSSSYCTYVTVYGNGTKDCKAAFSYSVVSGRKVSFYNSSWGKPLNVSWDFGDGNFSSDYDPSHIYASDGTYKVCLTVWTDSANCSDTYCTYIQVYKSSGCNAYFTYNASGNGVQFSSFSSGNISNYWWYFGDGSSSTKQNPYHQYSGPGTYNVCLFVFDSLTSCVDTFCTDVKVGGAQKDCKASFAAFDSSGYVYFSNYSAGSAPNYMHYSWDFGDGTTSTKKDPVHKYAKAGTYYVCLTVTDSLKYCWDKTCSYVTVGDDSTGCYAYFYYYADTAKNNNSAWFYNYSSGGVSWHWDFGDGTTSSDKDPYHVFPGPGVYQVCLTIKGQNCSDTYCTQVVIYDSANDPCKAGFYYAVKSGRNVYFTNASSGNYTNVRWDFGDGSVSYSSNPVHQYANNGTYKVCLTVWRDSACFNTYCQYIQVYDNAACKAYFTAYADTGSGVAFKNGSSGNPTKFFWDFGDGTTSVYENPYHVYQQKGNYKVCLTVSSGSCTDTWCDYIRVGCDSTDCPGMFSYYEDSTKAGQFYFYSNSNYPVVKWDFGDGNVAYQGPGASNYYQSSGTYRVCMTVLEDSIEVTYCDTIVVNRPVGIQKPAAAEIAGIYPNPASGIAYLSLKLVQKSNVRVVVQTLLGSTSEAFAAGALDAGEHRIALDTGSLPGGIYLVKVITDSNEKVIRLVVTD